MIEHLWHWLLAAQVFPVKPGGQKSVSSPALEEVSH